MLIPTAPRVLGEGDLAYARTKLGWALVRSGQPEHGLRQLEEAALTPRRTDPNGCLCWCLSLQAEAYAVLDRYEDASGLAKEAAEWREAGFAVFDGDAARSRAWVTARGGEHSRAVEELLAAAASQQARGQPAFALLALHDVLRLGDLHAAHVIEHLSHEVEGPYAPTVALHVSALRRSDPARLEDPAGALAGLGMRLLAAEVAHDAALEWSKRGHPARAAAAERVQHAHLRGREASALLSLRMPAATALPSPLTRRERDRDVGSPPPDQC